MTLPVQPPVAPMLARAAKELPTGAYLYEPKWDGFRCLAFRDARAIELRSKSGQPLGRYFPDLVAALSATEARRFVLDGEIVIPVGETFSFEELQLRLHPAASRVRRLAEAHPARMMLFDLLVDESGHDLTARPLAVRRAALVALMPRLASPALALSPASEEAARAQSWLEGVGTGRDGVMAKRLDAPYRAGERDGMVKIKRLRSADCVVGGFRYLAARREVGSLLLGLYDAAGLLDHVGFTSTIADFERGELTARLERRVSPPGFTGRAPGGPSRWTQAGRAADWQPLRPELVVEVRYDHVSGGRFRHGTTLLRWRPDKVPAQCRMEQIAL